MNHLGTYMRGGENKDEANWVQRRQLERSQVRIVAIDRL